MAPAASDQPADVLSLRPVLPDLHRHGSDAVDGSITHGLQRAHAMPRFLAPSALIRRGSTLQRAVRELVPPCGEPTSDSALTSALLFSSPLPVDRGEIRSAASSSAEAPRNASPARAVPDPIACSGLSVRDCSAVIVISASPTQSRFSRRRQSSAARVLR
jgi:hypothetical protein